jgi:hypothetical protein
MEKKPNIRNAMGTAERAARVIFVEAVDSQDFSIGVELRVEFDTSQLHSTEVNGQVGMVALYGDGR